MFEKVNKFHPDKVADRIAGAVLDLAYRRNPSALIAVEVLIGHGKAMVMVETNTLVTDDDVKHIVYRIGGSGIVTATVVVPQDSSLAKNQEGGMRCGDNGIFKGCPLTDEQKTLALFAQCCANDKVVSLTEEDGRYYSAPASDGKYIVRDGELIVCQSHDSGYASSTLAKRLFPNYKRTVNPLGSWEGGVDVDSGATNRKLGSDMGDAVTGGGLCGKDLSKADVSVNVWCHIKAQELGKVVTASCAIGDTVVRTSVGDVEFSEMVKVTRDYIDGLGGFEKFAEYGLIR